MLRKHFFKAFALFTVTFALAGAIFAQGTTSRITGTVTDSSGAVVAGATVSLKRVGTTVPLTTQTSDNGVYTFDLIQAGVYDITVEKTGFKKAVSMGNTAFINQPASVNVVLQAGDVSATVTVSGTAEQVQTTISGNIGVTVEQKALESLPIFGQRGRNPLDLINFVPGASTDITNESGGGVHVHGSRDRAFNFVLDGIDINESSFGGSNFTPLRPNPDSIQEFQIVTSNFTAELGRSSGANITFVTKSGTNDFHGNLFEYYQTPRLNANEYANKINARPRGQFVQHIYGGSFGGPLPNMGFGEGTPFRFLRDKAFFFVNLQMLRASETRLQTRTVLTALARTGLFRYRQGAANAAAGTATATVDAAGNPLFPVCPNSTATNCINTYNIAANSGSDGGLDPAMLALLNAMPLPNSFSAGGDGLNTAAFVWGAPQNERQYDFVSKFDVKLNDNNSFYIRYAQGQQNTIGDVGNGGAPSFPGYPRKVDTFRDPKNLAVNYRFSPTARFTNEAIIGFNNYAFSFNNPDPNWATNPAFIFNLVTDPFSNAGAINNARRIKTYQFADNITMDFSPHVLKAGVNFRFGRQIDTRTGVAGALTTLQVNMGSTGANGNPIPAAYNLGTGAGQLTPLINATDLTRLGSLINDTVGRHGRVFRAFVSNLDGSAFAPAGSVWNFTAFYPEYDFYLQDNWRFRSNLTFDIGMRYEIRKPPSSNQRPILRPSQSIAVGAPASTTLSWTEGKLFEDDYNNISPSVGFAWDPFKNGKTSIRGNYRISFDRLNSFLFASSIFQNAPGNTLLVTNTTGGLVRNGYPALNPAATTTPTPLVARTPVAFSTSSITVMDKDIEFPKVTQWSISFQRELFKNSVLEVNYIGNRGKHLSGGYDANQVNIRASDPRCPNQTFLDAFNLLRTEIAAGTGATANICLLNYLMNGSNATNAGTQAFRTNSTISPTLTINTPTVQTGGGVAAAALAVSQLNTGGVQSIIARGFSPSFFQRFPQFSGNLFLIDSNDISKYKGLEIIFSRRITGGLGFNTSYTWSVSKDSRSFDPTQTTVGTGTGQSAGSTPYDINNRLGNYSWSDFDRRHAIRGSYTYELPFGKGRMFGKDAPGVVDAIIGGWQLSGLVNISSGRPFTIYAGVNTLSNTVSATADCSGCTRDMGALIQESGTNFWLSTAQRALFTTPAPGTLGNTGRNFFIGPRFFQMDVALKKNFKMGERFNLDLKLDAKNVTNSISFTAPTNVITSATFGRIRDAVFSGTFARKLQIGMKLNF